MGQITKAFAEQLLHRVKGGQHINTTVWEEEQLINAWLRLHEVADIPTVIRRSTWRTPDLRESAARLVSNILRTDEDKALGPPVPPDHFPVA